MEEDIIISERPTARRLLATYPRTPRPGEHYDTHLATLQEWLCGGLSDFFRDDIEEYRAEQDTANKAALYDRLPVAIVACFAYLTPDGLLPTVCYNGLLDFDIRREENEGWDMASLKAALRAVPYIAYVGDDTNGEDLFCVVSIRWPNCYAHHLKALRQDLLKADIIISGSDSPAHFRKISHDPEGYINGDAQQFCKLL